MNQPLFNSRPAEILLVEDCGGDVLLISEAFKQTSLWLNLHHVENGEECLAFLRKEGRYAEAPTPDLILLDLIMPVMGGREAMAEIVADERLRHLPVVILSAYEQEIVSLYQLRCNSYIVKPMDFDQIQRVVREIIAYWFRIAVLPSDRVVERQG